MSKCIADGLEIDVLSSSLSIACTICGKDNRLQISEIVSLGVFDKQISENFKVEHVTGYRAKVTCQKCTDTFVVTYGFGEFQPARYMFFM